MYGRSMIHGFLMVSKVDSVSKESCELGNKLENPALAFLPFA